MTHTDTNYGIRNDTHTHKIKNILKQMQWRAFTKIDILDRTQLLEAIKARDLMVIQESTHHNTIEEHFTIKYPTSNTQYSDLIHILNV